MVDGGGLGLEVLGDGAGEAGVGDPVQRVGGDRQVAARQLVLALGAGLDAGEAVRDGPVDRLVAELEVQAGGVLDAAGR